MRVGALHQSQPANLRFVPSLVGLGVAILAFAWSHVSTLVEIEWYWRNSGTFAHGYFVLPMAAYLIWLKRGSLRPVGAASPSLKGLLLLMLLEMSVTVARIADVNAVEHLAVVAMVPALVWTFLGDELCRRVAFPLIFILFSAPIGLELTPVLMSITADLAVELIRLSGIPVVREGMYFETPTGTFRVARACSGVRFLVASVTLATLFAYLTFRSVWLRIVFVAIGAVVPIVANGVRAFGIVVIAHLSNMKYATGDDHLVYGWIFFALVTMLMLWSGLWLQKRFEGDPAAPDQPTAEAFAEQAAFRPRTYAGLTLIVVLLVAGSGRVEVFQTPAGGAVAALPEIDGWVRVPDSRPTWPPELHGDGVAGGYQTDSTTVGVYVLSGGDDAQRFFADASAWNKSAGRTIETRTAGSPPATLWRLRHNGSDYHAFATYIVGGRLYANRRIAKLAKVWTTLSAAAACDRFLLVWVGGEEGSDAPAVVQSLRESLGRELANCPGGTSGL